MSDSRRSVAPLIAFARAWKDGGGPTVEAFLAEHHPAGVGVDELLDLVQQEIVSREARGEVPKLDEYQGRFPDHAEHIGALFEVNALFATGIGGDGPPGPDLSDYEVEGRLAAGGMGEVYGARDSALGRRVAVKVLRPEWQDDPSSVARFWGEARTTARLQHPGVVPVYEAGLDARDRPFIAMKLVEGRTLAQLLADRADPADRLADFVNTFEHVCQTIAYAHQQKVIHRDLKPANVMVGNFGEVQVMDWGLAKRLGDEYRQADSTRVPAMPKKVDSTVPAGGLTVAGEMIGTPGYMPPEQARGDHDRVGPGSDVFGLGAILCEILTGKAPFDTVARARAADLGPARAGLAAVTGEAELVNLALTCLAPDPLDRPADAGAVCAALSAYRAGLRERVRAAELAAVKAAAERKARRRAEILRLTAFLLVLGAGAGAVGWYRHQSDLARDVEAALDEAQAARDAAIKAGGDPIQSAHADKAAHRAEGLMRGLSGRADLRRRCDALIAALEGDRDDPAMVRRLEEIRLLWDPSDPRPAGPPPGDQYVAAFRDYGIDVTSLAPDEAARRVNARVARADLIVALDYWGLQCLRSRGPGPVARHALAVSRLADPDPWRNQFRDAVERRDLPALRKMAGEKNAADLPVPILIVFGAAVADRSYVDPKSGWITYWPSDRVGVALLREARRRAPGDFWANYQLGVVLSRASPTPVNEVARYLGAAAAIRPDLPIVRGKLAAALEGAADFPGALAASREEVASHPDDVGALQSLATQLWQFGELTESAECFREVIRRRPADDPARSRLATVLIRMGDRAGALAVARQELRDLGDTPRTRLDLRAALAAAGLFEEALAEAKRETVLQKDREWGQKVVPSAQRKAEIAARVAAAADADELGALGDEVTEYTSIAFLTGRDAIAVCLFERAMADPRAPRWALVDAAAAAVRLGTGPSGAGLSAAERARCRTLALTWLHASLARRDPLAAVNQNPVQRKVNREATRRMEMHLDFAAVRDPEALAKLPGLERAGWKKYWGEVAAQVRAYDRGR
jgi:tRNA A-37 threonylcarbamoyl transferase component Bud32/tetratricopeptide (TPR) repeat protein